MGLIKKVAKAAKKAATNVVRRQVADVKTVAKGVKGGARLAGKAAKQLPPYHAGQVIGSLARGKAPRKENLLGMAGVITVAKPMPRSAMKKALSPRVKIVNKKKTAVGTAWSMPPKTAASSTSRPPRKKVAPLKKIQKQMKMNPKAPSRRQVGPPFNNMG